MHKPSLLYASPFPPQRSGIATYSRWLVAALSDYFDLTLYLNENVAVDGELTRFRVLKRGRDQAKLATFDHRIYHLGNHHLYHSYIYEACLKNPDWFVLHEFVLYYLVAGFYQRRDDFYRQIFRIGGANAISAVEASARDGKDPFLHRDPKSIALNRELLLSGNRIVVHSNYTYELVKQVAPEAHVYRSELVQGEIKTPAISRADCLARWGIPAGAIVVASFGFVVPIKLNHLVCSAVQRVAEQRGAPLYYLMVGEGDYIAPQLGERIKLTGYVSESEFDECLAHVDLVANLRFPTLGETSAALLRAFAFGKPCIVTDVGWLSELPKNVALKIDCSDPDMIEEQLVEALHIYLDCPLPFHKMGQEAAEYVRQRHSAAAVARRYFELLTRQN